MFWYAFFVVLIYFRILRSSCTATLVPDQCYAELETSKVSMQILSKSLQYYRYILGGALLTIQQTFAPKHQRMLYNTWNTESIQIPMRILSQKYYETASRCDSV